MRLARACLALIGVPLLLLAAIGLVPVLAAIGAGNRVDGATGEAPPIRLFWRSNCVFFATSRWFARGGYLIVRKSRHGPFPHFLWAHSIESVPVEQFVPVRPRPHLVPPLLFLGRVTRKDSAQ